MKNFQELTYPQQGAYNIFYHKFIFPKLSYCMKIAAVVSLCVGILIYTAWLGFWASLGITLVVVPLFLLTVFFTVTIYGEEMFEKKIKNSLFWQEYYLNDTIVTFKRIQGYYPDLIESLKPYDIPENLGLLEEFTTLPYKAENARNAFYTEIAKQTLVMAYNNYKKTLEYLAERNQTPSTA